MSIMGSLKSLPEDERRYAMMLVTFAASFEGVIPIVILRLR